MKRSIYAAMILVLGCGQTNSPSSSHGREAASKDQIGASSQREWQSAKTLCQNEELLIFQCRSDSALDSICGLNSKEGLLIGLQHRQRVLGKLSQYPNSMADSLEKFQVIRYATSGGGGVQLAYDNGENRHIFFSAIVNTADDNSTSGGFESGIFINKEERTISKKTCAMNTDYDLDNGSIDFDKVNGRVATGALNFVSQ